MCSWRGAEKGEAMRDNSSRQPHHHVGQDDERHDRRLGDGLSAESIGKGTRIDASQCRQRRYKHRWRRQSALPTRLRAHTPTRPRAHAQCYGAHRRRGKAEKMEVEEKAKLLVARHTEQDQAEQGSRQHGPLQAVDAFRQGCRD